MKTVLRMACVLLVPTAVLLTGCMNGGGFDQRARELGKAAAEGAIDAVRPKLVDVAAAAADKIDAALQARIDAAKAKPAEERSPTDWGLIALSVLLGTSGAQGLRGMVRRFLGEPSKKA